MRVVALAGGTGSAKLLRGLAKVGAELAVVANVGDNFWFHGAYVCPDVDIAVYALAGVLDRKRGWGLEGDTFMCLEQMRALGAETWFRLGDRDMALSLLRTEMLARGLSLTSVTRLLSTALGVGSQVLPATDRQVETHVITDDGEMHLQEYWVRLQGRPRVTGVKYVGARGARPTKAVAEAVGRADTIVFCPANPVTSIGPTLAVSGMKALIRGSRARKVAVSPMVGRGPFSGPAGKMMKGLGLRADSVGVAELYAGLVDALVVDHADASMAREVERAGPSCVLGATRMDSAQSEEALARLLTAN